MQERDLVLKSGGITLRGKVLVPAAADACPLTVLCHGIPSGVQVPGDTGYDALARRLVEGGTGACYFNFRGTGVSEGDFSLAGWVDDLSAVLEEAGKGEGPFLGCDPDRIALMGFSGGGMVSIICAARRGGLKAVATLASPADHSRLLSRESIGAFIAHARGIGIIRDPAFPDSEEEYYLEMAGVRPVQEMGGISPTPILIVHGDSDDLVPVEEAHRLFQAAGEPKELYVVKGGGHKLRHEPEAMDKTISWVLEKLSD
jgi:dipeptidyl aminopeptidase/acylaminoacyl peptidase